MRSTTEETHQWKQNKKSIGKQKTRQAGIRNQRDRGGSGQTKSERGKSEKADHLLKKETGKQH